MTKRSPTRELADRDGKAFCHPYDDAAVIAGQGTLGLELVEDLDDLSCVIIPIGGGGLASGVAIAVKSLMPGRPDRRRAGSRLQPLRRRTPSTGAITTLADGIAVKHPGDHPTTRRGVDRRHRHGRRGRHRRRHGAADGPLQLYVEGAGAVGVAALRSGAVRPPGGGHTCVVLSGGNVDLGVVPGLIRRHETTAGRRLVVFTRDRRPSRRPGQAALRVRLQRSQPDRRRAPPRGRQPQRPPDRACTRRSRCAARITWPRWSTRHAKPASRSRSNVSGPTELPVRLPTGR